MEVLYPDVIGSGGAPKRIMKPRRRTDGPMTDDPDMPGTGILNLTSDHPPPRPPGLESPNSRPMLTQTPTTSSTGSATQPRPTSTTIPPRGPPTVANANALTPPDETITQSRKRQLPTTSTPNMFESTPPATTIPMGQSAPESPGKRRRTSSNDGSRALSASVLNSSMLPLAVRDGPSAASPSQADSQNTNGPVMEEIVEAVRSRNTLRWQEEALDIFFRDFADEDLDLQVKISEGVLINECKAMVFCKMPSRVRQHWVKRFKETPLRQ